MTVTRTAINPWTWSAELGFDQAVLVSGQTRTLYCSGQTSMTADGRPEHDGDIAAQLALSLANLDAVLAAAGMTRENLVRLNVYTTDVDALFPHYATLGTLPATTLLGVTRLAIPGQLVELEATAVQ
ncbi:RidA family protein [Actinoplanes couchii]|nr:RidA family protein [Actinoplanes couchii]MDR6317874.1 enamine deaminase RidA (YjgF/YER057c/UK114 family) [Actinoplanes couchii]